ncbi:MAG: AAA family ATPase [Christensenellaceae bacterium]|jgi:hypothetical protein|nr:AAA family ATPase [Christensenellaceae bacterium]
MSNYWIKKLSILGENKTTSSIEFDKGLNVIYGVSDTGKTCIIKCIDYVFGGSDDPIPMTHGFDTIQLLIEIDNSTISLQREIGKNKVKVNSGSPNIVSGDYTLNDIKTILPALIGITNRPQIIKNGKYEKQNLTWRTFMHSFIINENEVIQPEPILISKESTAKTASISGLLYLISAPDFSKIDEKEDKKIREARKRAVEVYVSSEITNLTEKQKELKELLKKLDPTSAETIIEKIVYELENIENLITQEAQKSQGTLAKLLAERDHIAECDLLLNRYIELRSQYIADIKRLSFIVDGEECIGKMPIPDKCPYCDSNMPKHIHTSYVEQSNNELIRITNLLNDLAKAETTAKEERDTAIKNITLYSTNRATIENYINKDLKPKSQELQATLKDYRTLIRLQNELELVDKTRQEKVNYLNELLAKTEEKYAEYKPREHFPAEFEKIITEMLVATLKDCKYDNFISGQFSLNTFDVIVNAKRKADFGKGYRAFLNVMLAIVLREYLDKYGAYKTRLLIVDSPLLSLKENIENAPETMKIALMEHLMKTQSVGQTIIIENEIPDIDYTKYNVKLQKFNGDRNLIGRYGLLTGVYK